MVLAAFGDTDNDGDIDMIGLVCYTTTVLDQLCVARLIFYENIAGSIPGTSPIWENRSTNNEKADLSVIAEGDGFVVPAGPNNIETSYGGIPFNALTPNVLILVDYDDDGDLDLVFNNNGNSDKKSISLSKNIGNATHGIWNTTTDVLLKTVGNLGHYIYFPRTISFADMDKDGDLDCVVKSGDFDNENVFIIP